jgi:hypothetical protein
MPYPRAIVSATGAAPNGGAANLVDNGGPVLSSVEVVPIYWGAAWNGAPNAQIAAQLDGFFDFIVTSSLIDLLAEYGRTASPIGRGRRAASVHAADSEPGTGGSVADTDIQQALQAWIAVGSAPAVTANTLYFIFLPPGIVSVEPNGAASCVSTCGHHGNIGAVYYAVIPYINCPTCLLPGASFFDTLTVIASHEFCESITDPMLTTWYDPLTGDEIGDICNRQSVRLGPYLVQAEWSNIQGACVFAPPPPPTT